MHVVRTKEDFELRMWSGRGGGWKFPVGEPLEGILGWKHPEAKAQILYQLLHFLAQKNVISSTNSHVDGFLHSFITSVSLQTTHAH